MNARKLTLVIGADRIVGRGPYVCPDGGCQAPRDLQRTHERPRFRRLAPQRVARSQRRQSLHHGDDQARPAVSDQGIPGIEFVGAG